MKTVRKIKVWSDHNIALAVSIFAFIYFYFRSGNIELGYDYYNLAARSFLETGSFFSSVSPVYLNELIETAKGYISALPPLPMILMIPFSWLGAGEIRLAQVMAGASAALIYLVARRQGLDKERSLIFSAIWFFTTPVWFLSVNEGSWYTAQLVGATTALGALLFLLNKKYLFAGLMIGMAFTSRVSLGAGFIAGLAGYMVYQRKMRQLGRMLIGFLPFVVLYMAYNYYRFGSVMQSGYALIPGIESEWWFEHGVMSWRYVVPNLKRFLLQNDYSGMGLGMIFAQPYLLLLPFIRKSKQSIRLVIWGVPILLIVLMHGSWGFFQFDFRFALDFLWLWIPALAYLKKKYMPALYILAGYAFLVHLLGIAKL